MKCLIPEISWHNREGILSIDIHPTTKDFFKLATGGCDSYIMLWRLKSGDNGEINVEAIAELKRHQRAVNVVRWKPDGKILASGDDAADIILWQLKTDAAPSLDDDEDAYEEKWVVLKVLRGHKEDVYDLAWSPDGSKLLSGSVDNTAIIWDFEKLKNEALLTDHKSFVQGVAWDPKNEYIATLSSDRMCRVFDTTGKQVKARIGKGLLPVEESHQLYNKEVKYFHDDTFKTFFRRLTFSPDGSFLVVPSGSVETEECKHALYATFIFTLDSLKQPAVILPSGKQCSIVAKCCPKLFELHDNGPTPYVNLPYRMIIAVATDSDVLLYDTQQKAPFALLQKLHYTRLTDLAWSPDGLLLVVSSSDGYISMITFDKHELGIEYIPKEEDECEESFMNTSISEDVKEEKPVESEVVPVPVEVKPKRASFIEQWAKQGQNAKKPEPDAAEVKAPKRIRPITLESKSETKSNEESTTVVDPVEPPPKRRVQLITLTTPKKKKSQNTPSKTNESETLNTPTNKEKEATVKTPTNKKNEATVNTPTNKKKEATVNTPTNRDKEATVNTPTNKEKELTVNKPEESIKNTDAPKIIETIDLMDDDSMPATNTDAPKVQENTTPKLNNTNKPSTKSNERKSSVKKNQKTTTPSSKMSLLQFFKPISASKQVDQGAEIKVKTGSLFKTENGKHESLGNAVELLEDSVDVPEDFRLVVENSNIEKENAEKKEEVVEVPQDRAVEVLRTEVKPPRRVPLITISSPKNKKKKENV